MFDYINGGLFKSAEPWIHPERIIDSNEIVFVTKGTVFIEEDGIKYTLQKDDVLYLERKSLTEVLRKAAELNFTGFTLKANAISNLKRLTGNVFQFFSAS